MQLIYIPIVHGASIQSLGPVIVCLGMPKGPSLITNSNRALTGAPIGFIFWTCFRALSLHTCGLLLKTTILQRPSKFGATGTERCRTVSRLGAGCVPFSKGDICEIWGRPRGTLRRVRTAGRTSSSNPFTRARLRDFF
jgi:hypothetical protein